MPGPLQPHHSAFPAQPPRDLDDAATIIANDWSAFAALERTKNHWKRAGWTSTTRRLYWLLTFEQPQLTDAVLDHQERLRPLGLDHVRPEELHLTLTRVGDRETVSADQVHALVQTATGRVGAAFDLVAHPLAGSAGAVRYSVTPWTDLISLHRALGQFNQALGLPGGKDSSSFRPHIGLGYQPRERAAAPVIDAVARLRSQPPIPVAIRHLDLVELRREPGRYTWTTLGRIPLPQPEN